MSGRLPRDVNLYETRSLFKISVGIDLSDVGPAAFWDCLEPNGQSLRDFKGSPDSLGDDVCGEGCAAEFLIERESRSHFGCPSAFFLRPI